MTKTQIESKVIAVADAIIEKKQRREDPWTELKREWPEDLNRMSRQLAGHANAARGNDILWIVGIDETAAALKDIVPPEFSTWIPQLRACFDDGVMPLLTSHFDIPYKGHSLYALLFETDRAPYVVKTFNSDRLEVPWREGNRTDSAKRADLLKILAPLTLQPEFEVLQAFAHEHGNQLGQLELFARVVLYNRRDLPNKVVIPKHQSSAYIVTGDKQEKCDYIHRFTAKPGALISHSETELIISGPGAAIIEFVSIGKRHSTEDDLNLLIKLRTTSSDHDIQVHLPPLKYLEDRKQWAYGF